MRRLSSLISLTIIMLLVGASSSLANVKSEREIKKLYDEGLRVIDSFIAEANAMGLPDSPHHAELKLLKMDAIENSKDIHKIEFWRDELADAMAESIMASSRYVMSLAGERMVTDMNQLRTETSDYCEAVIEPQHTPLEAALTANMEAYGLFTDETKARNEVIMRELRQLAIKRNIFITGQLNKMKRITFEYDQRRELVGRPLWTVRHTMENMGREESATKLRTALAETVGLSGRAYLTLPEMAFRGAGYLRAVDHCRSQFGNNAYSFYLDSSTGAHAYESVTRPYEEFNDEEAFLPSAPHNANSRLGILAETLAHRKIQTFRLQAISQKLAPEIQSLSTSINAMAADLKLVRDSAYLLNPLIKRQSDIIALLNEATKPTEREQDMVGAIAALEGIVIEERAIYEATRANYSPKLYRWKLDGTLETLESEDPTGSTRVQLLQEVNVELEKRNAIIADLEIKRRNHINNVKPNDETRDKWLNIVDSYDTSIREAKKSRAPHDAKRDLILALPEDVPPNQDDIREAEETLVAIRQHLKDYRAKQPELTRDDLNLNAARREANLRIRQSSTKLRNQIGGMASYSKELSEWVSVNRDVFDAYFPDPLEDTDYARNGRELFYELEDGLTNAIAAKEATLEDLLIQQKENDVRLKEVRRIYANAAKLASQIISEEMPDREVTHQAEVIKFMKEHQQVWGRINGVASAPSDVFANFESSVDFSDQVFEIFEIPRSEFIDGRVEKAREAIGRYSEAAAAIAAAKGQVDQALEITQYYEDWINPKGRTSGDKAFNQLKTTLQEAETAFGQIPVLGDVTGYYFGFMNDAVSSIHSDAQSIRASSINRWVKQAGVPPEQHLYTARQLKAIGISDTSSWFRIGGSSHDDVLIPMQIRRIVAILGAKNIEQACNRRTGVIKNKHIDAGHVACGSQGRI